MPDEMASNEVHPFSLVLLAEHRLTHNCRPSFEPRFKTVSGHCKFSTALKPDSLRAIWQILQAFHSLDVGRRSTMKFRFSAGPS